MTGFDAADFFQTEQTVNRKISGFRAARYNAQCKFFDDFSPVLL